MNYYCYYGFVENYERIFNDIFTNDEEGEFIGNNLLDNWTTLVNLSYKVIDYFDDGGMIGGDASYENAGNLIG